MQLPNSGMSATMNAIIIKNWDWKSILTGIIRKKHIKEICGINSFRHRQRRRPASSWTRHGNLLCPEKRPGGIKAPNPPVFKQDNIPVTYMQMGIRHEKGSDQLRLSLPKDMKSYMEETYGIHEKFLYLENKIFRDMDHIKTAADLSAGKMEHVTLLLSMRLKSREQLSQNGHYLSVDLGLHNLMTCYDSEMAGLFILGNIFRWKDIFIKEIARVQSVWYAQQSERGIKYPRSSKHIQRLYRKKQNAVKDYLHKVTRWIAEYCRKEDIRCGCGRHPKHPQRK